MRTPTHYDFKIQPIDFILANDIPFCEGNIIKYVSRWKLKNGREDLLKAKHYLDMLLSSHDKDCCSSYLDASQDDASLWDPTSGPSQ